MKKFPKYERENRNLGATELKLITPRELTRLRRIFDNDPMKPMSRQGFMDRGHGYTEIMIGNLYGQGGSRAYLIYENKERGRGEDDGNEGGRKMKRQRSITEFSQKK